MTSKSARVRRSKMAERRAADEHRKEEVDRRGRRGRARRRGRRWWSPRVTAAAASDKDLIITAAVKRQTLQDKVTLSGTLGRVEQRKVNAAGGRAHQPHLPRRWCRRRSRPGDPGHRRARRRGRARRVPLLPNPRRRRGGTRRQAARADPRGRRLQPRAGRRALHRADALRARGVAGRARLPGRE